MDQTPPSDRRRHRRLDLAYPLSCRRPAASGRPELYLRTAAGNVGAGGVYFEARGATFDVGEVVELEIDFPPSEGVVPHRGTLSGKGEIVRIDRLTKLDETSDRRFGIAARFLDGLRVTAAEARPFE